MDEDPVRPHRDKLGFKPRTHVFNCLALPSQEPLLSQRGQHRALGSLQASHLSCYHWGPVLTTELTFVRMPKAARGWQHTAIHSGQRLV